MPKGMLAAAFAAGMIAAGCGGSDEGSGVETAGLSKDQWIAQANRICAVGDRELEKEAERVFAGHKPPTEGELSRFGREVVVPGVQAQVDQIRALDAPKGDEDEIEAIFAAAEDAIDEVRAKPATLEGGGPFAEVNALAGEYGLDECAD
jgi:hypothetical protein